MSVNKVNSDGSTTLIAGATLWADSPIGTILPYGGATAPAGFLLCDGAEKNKTDYPELYAVIGDAFGTASVNTKFVLPDLREATTKGAGLTGKSNNHYDSDGVALGEFIDDRLQEHRHQTVLSNAQSGSGQQLADQGSGQSTYATGNVYSSARKGDTTEVKAVGVNYIIKSKQVALPADLESAVEDAVEEVYGDIIPSDASSSNKVLVNSDKTSTVTSGSTAPITSGGVYEALANTLKYNSTVWNTSKSITINRSNALGHVYMISANGYWDNTDGLKYYVGIVKDPANNNTNPIITDLAKSSGITVSVTEKSANSLTLNFSGFSGEAVVTSVITIS